MGLEKYRIQVQKDKQEAILGAALELFLKYGYDQTKVDMIAQQADVSTATLYKHFHSKEELFNGLIEQAWGKDTSQTIESFVDLPIEEAVRRVGFLYAEMLMRPMMLSLFRVIIAEVNRFPHLTEELYQRGKIPMLDALSNCLQEAIKRSEVEIADISLATRQYLAMINSLIFWPRFLLPTLNFTQQEIDQVVNEAVATFLARYSIKK
jgi:TetR/AcrR family transcriptional regulator, regulator of autoinduction and epiphytic fitness